MDLTNRDDAMQAIVDRQRTAPPVAPTAAPTPTTTPGAAPTDRNDALSEIAARRNADLRGAAPGSTPSPTWTDPSTGFTYDAAASDTFRSDLGASYDKMAAGPRRYAEDVRDQYAVGANAPGGGVGTGLALAARAALGGAVANTVDSFGDGARPVYQTAKTFITGELPSTAPPNAGVHPSMLKPRTSDWGMNNRSIDGTTPGPIQDGAGRNPTLPDGITRNGNAYSGSGVTDPNAPPPMTTDQANAFFGAQLDAIRAREAQQAQANAQANADNMQSQIQRGRAYDVLHSAEQNARVANFLSRNGADAVGGPTWRGVNPARGPLVAAAEAANARLAAARGASIAGEAPGGARYSPIDDYAKSEATALAQQDAALKQPGILAAQQGAQMDLASRKELAALDAQIAAETDPKKLQQLHQKRLALAGKPAETKVAVVDVDTGEKDAMGQPIFKKMAVNPTTGEFLQPPQPSDRITQLRSMSNEDALKQAKSAVARGAKLDDVNALLKASGKPTL